MPVSKTTAGAAGMGGGTLLVVVANNLPEGHPWKPWLVLFAPTVSVLAAGAWYWLQAQAAAQLRELQFRAAVKRAKGHLTEQLRAPDLSEDERERLQQNIKELRALETSRLFERIKALQIVTPPTSRGARR